MFTDVVTIYNHYLNSDGDSLWHRTVLEDVQVSSSETNNVDTDGKMNLSKELRATIPYRNGYVEPIDYEGTGFTFGLDNLDIIVVGNVTDEITAQFTITHLQRKYQTTGVIKSFTDNTRRTLLKHWSVVAQ